MWMMADKGCLPTRYVAEAIFFLFKIAEAMLDPSVRLYIYQSVCQVGTIWAGDTVSQVVVLS